MARRSAVLLLVGASVFFGSMSPARACSCVGPPVLAAEFEGEAVETTGPSTLGKVWRFRVTVADRGPAVDETVDVAIDGVDPPTNEVQMVSSCSIGPYPKAGGLYSVGAYQGSRPNGSPMLFANSCGGHLRALSSPPPAEPEQRASEKSTLDVQPTPPADGGSTKIPALIALVSLVAAAVLVTGAALKRESYRGADL